MNAYNIVNESVMLKEYFGVDDIATVGLKYYNEEKRTQMILSAYPTPQALAAKLKQTGDKRAIKLAMKLDGLNEIQYRKFVMHYFGGRTFLRWLGNLLGSPFSTIYQAVQTAKLNSYDANADQVINSRL